MGTLSKVVEALEKDARLDAPAKSILAAFLQAAGATIDAMDADALIEVLGAASTGGAVTEAIARHLDARQVAALLEATEAQMSGLAQRHGTQARAAEVALAQLQAAALAAVAQALLGAL